MDNIRRLPGVDHHPSRPICLGHPQIAFPHRPMKLYGELIHPVPFAALVKGSRGDAAVLLSTLFITLFFGLTEAIVVGFALGSVLFIHRMSKTTAIETHTPFVSDDRADTADGGDVYLDEKKITHMPDYQRVRLGIGRTFQVPRFLQRSSIRDNLLIGADLGNKIGYLPGFFGRKSGNFNEDLPDG